MGRAAGGLSAGTALAVPRHVALIMDGNRRWARRHGRLPWDGHAVGFDKVLEVASWVESLGIAELTLWMLSTDNLDRPADEVDALVPIICRAIDDLVGCGRFSVRHVGNAEVLPDPLRRAVDRLPSTGTGGPVVNLAVGYGGLDEIERAVRRYLDAQDDGIDGALAGLDLPALEAAMGPRPSPPDLIVRTSGERRLSGFLLWSSAGARFHVVDRHWPDFGYEDLLDALATLPVSVTG